ncbi:MAG: CopG family transcriptional regulator [Pyrinomonadaceae bacterium]
MKRRAARKVKATLAPRASVTFPPELYHTLEQLAKQKKVSVAWVVREAAEKYVVDQWPLFGKDDQRGSK